MEARLVLASASPQRRQLLQGLGLSFAVVPSTVDERACTERDPARRAVALALLKAQDVARRERGAWVIGCDTLVVSPDGELFEKAEDAVGARRMMEAQSGRTSVVHSGLSLFAPDGRHEEGLSSSDVTFAALSPAQIDGWIAGGLWRDRSGSFQIDGQGQLLIRDIRGDWTSIVGFPVFLFGALVERLQAPFLRP